MNSQRSFRNTRRWLVVLMALAVLPCWGEEEHEHHHHHHQQVAPGFTRTIQNYQVPDVRLIRDDGASIASPSLFETDKAVVVSFIFTSCSAICPVLTATLNQMRQRLGPGADKVRIVSVSIDPEYDTPARLSEYARLHQVGGDWHFFTGERAAIVEMQKAFGAYRGDKNNHVPLALIRPAGKTQWVRLEGFTSAEDLVDETRRPPRS